MHIISKKALREFWTIHPDAERPLRSWYQLARQANWKNFVEVRTAFPSADQVEKFTVFDIGGNKYRLITEIRYNRSKIYIRFVYTHKEYEIGRWKI